MKLYNKVALITGWASGIWKAIAREFYKNWAIVIITDINTEAWKKLEQELENSLFLKLDVSKEEAWQKTTNTIIEKYWHIDIFLL